ncbi:MAG TPA: flagellar hook capping FlgD N-terminal domain-containing protein [Actinophytocola sp.]|jgi:flagellar basal-body rod modification protein FlgD|uniref:flagellar hook assembly protein FlgD n=1 Tax=Actinophytocola sp. TaxID=1872138 RepID=UPI002DB8D3AB|nr:flagellar hook capping FlgD N-terminal domain-containing protein [Actinophytocola sp.]HEU5474218.1 flagellar hook capping FlgD N-terminal domain-containing protein [Actinophytocola sp.]
MTSPINGSTPATQQQRPQGMSGMTSDDFMKLLVAQLKYQDPTNPSDATTFMSQTAQLSTVDTLTSLARSQSEMLASALSTEASGLVGHTVRYLNADGAKLTGNVTGANFGTSPTVTIDGTDIPLQWILGRTQTD